MARSIYSDKLKNRTNRLKLPIEEEALQGPDRARRFPLLPQKRRTPATTQAPRRARHMVR